jgi:glycosyltransferase involved in cell wall biosynthesis
MKILQVISTFYPALAFGGPVKVAYDISRELAKKGHEVEVYTTNAYDQTHNFKPKSREQIINGFKVTYFENLLRTNNVFLSPEMIVMPRKSLKKFDVVHIHFGRQLHDIAMGYFARKYYLPYILQAHGSLPRIMGKQRLKWIYDALFGYRVLRGASKVIALSQTEAKQCRGMGVPEEKIAIVPNGIDFSEYGDLPSKGSFKKKFNIEEDKKIILYLGRIHKTKGTDLLIKAYAYLIKNMRYYNSMLVIVGPDDGYMVEAKLLTKSLDVSDSVLFTGFINSKDKLEALVDSDVFVTPSFYGFPLTFLEACATGTPIVTTTLGDILEWINGNVGYVTSPTRHDLANAIHAIISDNGLHEKFSSNCKKIVKFEFSLEKMVKKIEQVYSEVA